MEIFFQFVFTKQLIFAKQLNVVKKINEAVCLKP